MNEITIYVNVHYNSDNIIINKYENVSRLLKIGQFIKQIIDNILENDNRKIDIYNTKLLYNNEILDHTKTIEYYEIINNNVVTIIPKYSRPKPHSISSSISISTNDSEFTQQYNSLPEQLIENSRFKSIEDRVLDCENKIKMLEDQFNIHW